MTTKKPICDAQIELLSKIQNKTESKPATGESKFRTIVATVTDETGNFIFDGIESGQYSLSCFFKMTGHKTYFTGLPREFLDSIGRWNMDSNFVVNTGETYVHDFYLMVACPYDETREQDDCPNCHKKDSVQPILWGLPVLDENGNWPYGDLSKYYMGGCSPDLWCNPTKHCNRCNLDF